MKKKLLSMALLAMTISANAQNVQVHYDFGRHLYPDQEEGRQSVTMTLEQFKADKWGSWFYFVDVDFSNKFVEGAYTEISREFNIGKKGFAAHVEYDGGLNRFGSFQHSALLGGAWNGHSADFSKTYSVQLMYKYLAHKDNHGGCSHSAQLTEVWGLDFCKGLLRFSGYCDLWYDNGVNGRLVLGSESQFWVNLWHLPRINDNAKWSVGTELEISNNLVWPTDGKNNRFYAIPTVAMKWTF